MQKEKVNIGMWKQPTPTEAPDGDERKRRNTVCGDVLLPQGANNSFE
jgi:hypothetical protein